MIFNSSDIQDTVDKISGSDWFQGASEETITELVKRSSTKKYDAGKFVYMSANHSDRVYYIISGKIALSVIDQSGEEFGLTIWEAGSWFGETALHGDGKMPLQAKVKTNAVLLEVPITVIDDVLENSAVVSRNIMLDVIGRTKMLYGLMGVLLFKPLRARVAMRVLHLVEQFGEQDGDSIILPIKLSQSDFAKMSGGSRQRINGIFREWADQAIIKKENNRYVLRNIEALNKELEATEN